MLKNVIFSMKCDDNKLLSTCNFRYSTLELNYNKDNIDNSETYRLFKKK